MLSMFQLYSEASTLPDHYDLLLDFMRHPNLFQFPGQRDGYTTLDEAIESEWFQAKQRLQVARDITKLLAFIHERRCIQTDFHLNDVRVAYVQRVRILDYL